MKNAINYLSIIILGVFTLMGCKKVMPPPPPPVSPVINSINPTSGVVGAQVTINGANFDIIAANNTVKVNGVAATIVSATATTLIVNAPVLGATGPITETTSGGTATGPVFTYLLAPTIASLSPNSAAAGATVTITGTNFDVTAANNAVKFNGTTATVVTATATQLVVTVPAGGTSGNVTVTTTGGTSNGVAFTYTTTVVGPDIYVLGSDTQHGYGFWKNSVFTYIPGCNTAYAMVGIGPDVYIAGPSATNTPTYWKNGTAVQLSNQTGNTFSIYVSGPDLYCLGLMHNAYYVWKNGTPTALNTTALSSIGGTNAGSYLNNAMAVDNGNVYVAGFQYLPQSTITKATYWKNGNPIDLTDGTAGNAWATAVYVSGPDLYVAGVAAVSGGYAPRLWKNGISVPLVTPSASLYVGVSSILVVGTDVYVGGEFAGAGAVWKNGTMINTATYSVAENVSSMYLYNNTDLYITGASSSSGNNCYWKNGNFVEMDPGCQVLNGNCAHTFANQVIAIYVH